MQWHTHEKAPVRQNIRAAILRPSLGANGIKTKKRGGKRFMTNTDADKPDQSKPAGPKAQTSEDSHAPVVDDALPPESQAISSQADNVDLQLISDIIMQLNIVRKNTSLYPEDHPQLKMCMARVTRALEKHFYETLHQELVLGVVGDSLLADGAELADANPIYAEFSEFLHDRSILSLTIENGFSRDEMLLAISVLTDESSQSDLAKALADHEVTHVSVSIMDYDNLKFTENLDATDDIEEEEEGESGQGVWQEYVRGLLEKAGDHAFTSSDQGILLTDIDPEKLADFLNQLENNKDMELSYDKIAAKYLDEIALTAKTHDMVKDALVKKNFVNIINNLSPEMRIDFLKETFTFSSKAPHITADLLRQLPAKILLAAIRQIKKTDSSVNPAILALVDQLAATEAMAETKPSGKLDISSERQQELEANALSFLSVTGMGKKPEKGRAELLDLLEAKIAPKAAKIQGNINEDINPLSVSKHFTSVMLDLLENSIDPKQAKNYARMVSDLISEHLTMARWDMLVQVWKEMDNIRTWHEYDKPYLDQICLDAKRGLWDTENILFISTAILQYGMDNATELIEILRQSGEQCGTRMVDALIEEENISIRGVQIKLIAMMPENTLPYVIKNLDDDRWYVVRNMLNIIKNIGDGSAMDKIEELATGGDPKVRVEALRTIARVGSSRTPELILSAIADPDPEISINGISVAGLIFHSGVTAALVDIITDKRAKDEANLAKRLRAVKSLASIKDPEVLDELHALISSKKLFAGTDFSRVKLEIYRSLKHYPLNKVKNFAETGLKDSNVEIVDMAKRLAAKIAKA